MFTLIYFLIFSLIFSLYTFSNFTVGQLYLVPKNYNPVLTKPEKISEDFNEVITAQSVLIFDKTTQVILWQKEAESPKPIASLTKLLTALVFLETNPNWEETIKLEDADFRRGGSFYLRNNENLTVKDLFYLSLISSDNVATLALVRSTGLNEEEFVKLMNQKARLLGMVNTNLTDPTGVAVSNVSTAKDLYKLAMEVFDRPLVKEVTSLNNYLITVNLKEQRYITNTNKLLINQETGVLRGKTGYLKETGYCLISEIAKSNQRTFFIILLGSQEEESRFTETVKLVDWVNNNFIFYN